MRSARWLYVFGTIPFIVSGSAKCDHSSAIESCPTPLLIAMLTHTVTHTRNCAERVKEERTDIPSAPLF